MRRARDVGLSDETDVVIVEYALGEDLVIVTFDPDFRSSAMRKGSRCLHIRPPNEPRGAESATTTTRLSCSFGTGQRSLRFPPRDLPSEVSS